MQRDLPPSVLFAGRTSLSEWAGPDSPERSAPSSDHLTGLPDRRALVNGLRQRLVPGAQAGAQASELALLMVGLDDFKTVNDLHGMAVGDQLLCQAADRLRACVRVGDLLVRLFGDTFAVVQSAAHQPDAATALGRRLLAVLAEPFHLGGQMVQLGASLGVAVAPFDGDTPDALLRNAERATYRAKADGRGVLRFFEPAMDNLSHARRELEADLRQAVAERTLHLAYQPQVDLASQRVRGVEALLRWQHPQRGNVPPDAFIGLAEACGLIVPLGRWVLEQACRDALAWPENVRVAVNVSAVQFRRGGLLVDVLQALSSTGLPPQRLEVEVTESVMLTNAAQALGQLHELHRLGVQVAMDDFGTGFSSLSTLRSFPFHRIKIDRSFVRDLPDSQDARAIVRAVAGLGRSLGMATTVEGVETDAQLKVVETEGCSEVQGYLFSRPRPAADLPELIRTLGCPATPAPA